MLEKGREKLTTDRLRTELWARYDLLKGGKSSKSSDTAFLLLKRSGELADAAGKNAEMSAEFRKGREGYEGR